MIQEGIIELDKKDDIIEKINLLYPEDVLSYTDDVFSYQTELEIDKINLKDKFNEALSSLSGFRKDVFMLFYGLSDGKKHSYAEISNMLGISKERVIASLRSAESIFSNSFYYSKNKGDLSHDNKELSGKKLL